jgi:hypothetical protein
MMRQTAPFSLNGTQRRVQARFHSSVRKGMYRSDVRTRPTKETTERRLFPVGDEPQIKEPSFFFAVQLERISQRREVIMTRTGLIAGAVALSVSIGAPVAAQNANQMLKGTAIGAGGGALAGALIPGMSVGTGALVGAAGGAAYTALKKNRHYYRDSRGRRYYVSKNGYRVYK